MNAITTLSAQQLRHAADIKDKIESLHGELGRILGSAARSILSPAPASKKRHTMSAAARAKIAAAAKARWAKVKGTKSTSTAAPKQKAKRQMSAAARAKIAAAAKARWAKVKAAKS